MPNTDRNVAQPNGDLHAAIQAIQREVVKLAASARVQESAAQPSEARGRSRAKGSELLAPARPLPEAPPGPRGILRVVTSLPGERPTRHAEGVQRAPVQRAQRKPDLRMYRRLRRSRSIDHERKPDLLGPAPQPNVPQDLVRSMTEEIQAATTVIGGWIELMDRGMLTPDEIAIACQRIRAAQSRIETAGERLELAMGINRRRLHEIGDRAERDPDPDDR